LFCALACLVCLHLHQARALAGVGWCETCVRGEMYWHKWIQTWPDDVGDIHIDVYASSSRCCEQPCQRAFRGGCQLEHACLAGESRSGASSATRLDQNRTRSLLKLPWRSRSRADLNTDGRKPATPDDSALPVTRCSQPTPHAASFLRFPAGQAPASSRAPRLP
jgi:hypothetical protein